MSVQTVTFAISSGNTVSDVVHFRNASAVGLVLPTLNAVTSLGMKVAAAGDADVASAGMSVLHDSAGVILALGVPATGGVALPITDHVKGFSALQLVTPTAQTAPRTVTLSIRL